MSKQKQPTVSEVLRAAYLESGISYNQVWRDTNIQRQCVSRFAHGGGLSIENTDRLAQYLGFELRRVSEPSRMGE